jgi:hypothetical protein
MHYMKINVFIFLFQSNIVQPSFIRHMYFENIKAWVCISVADPEPHPNLRIHMFLAPRIRIRIRIVTSSDPARDP